MPGRGTLEFTAGTVGEKTKGVAKQWYFSKNLTQMGPVDEGELRSKIATGEILPTDKVWTEGMADWQPLAQVPALSPDIPLRVPPASSSPYSPPATSPVYPVVPASPPTSGLAIASLVCGLVGLLSCTFITGLGAVVCGHLALNRINASPTTVGGKTLAVVGLATGYISLIILAVFVIAFVLAVVVGQHAPHVP